MLEWLLLELRWGGLVIGCLSDPCLGDAGVIVTGVAAHELGQ